MKLNLGMFEKVACKVWVGLDQTSAIRLGVLHNDITHEFFARDYYSTMCSLRARWMSLGAPTPELKDGVPNQNDPVYLRAKKECFRYALQLTS